MRVDAKQIAAVARTISQCFANDALIQWLRPGRTPWNRNGVEQAWQRRRIQRAVFEGQVFRSNIIGKAKPESPSSHKNASIVICEASCEGDQEDDDAGVAVILFPPKEQRSYSLRRLWQGLKIWILDLVAPVSDDGSKYKV